MLRDCDAPSVTSSRTKARSYLERGALFLCGMVFSTLGTKAWFKVQEEEKRKQAEKKLRASEQNAEKFSTLFHAASFAMALAADPDGELYDVNQAWLDLAGFTRKEEVIGKSGLALELIREAESRARVLNEFRKHGSVRNAEIVTSTRAGVRRDLLVNVDGVDIGGRMFVLSSMQNITERKQAEHAVRRKEAELSVAQRLAHIGSWYWDAKTDRTTGSDELFLIFGFDPATQSMPDLSSQKGLCYPNEEWERVNAAVQRTLRTGADYELDVQAIRDGAPIWITMRGEAVHDADGRIVGLRGTVQDITGRKQAESDIVQLNEDMAARNLELEFLNKELEAFTYSVSHDLTAPIRHLSGFAKVLAENYADKLDAEGNNYLGRIQAGSAKATRLIDDLLRLSRISRQDMKRTEMDLSNKALEVIADLREASPGRNVQVRIAPGLKAAVDPRLVEVVLSNLLGNAWKFTSKTGSAHIEFGTIDCGVRSAECGARNGRSEIRNLKSAIAYYVKDNGAGFDPAYANKMFRPFQRLHSENEFEGTGIGLAIVERIIRRHGGCVWAEGEVGKGATVFFTLR